MPVRYPERTFSPGGQRRGPWLQAEHHRDTAAQFRVLADIEPSDSLRQRLQRLAERHDDDLRAIAVYLKGLPQREEAPKRVADSDPEMRAGSAIFADRCGACH